MQLRHRFADDAIQSGPLASSPVLLSWQGFTIAAPDRATCPSL